jgi:hypothetical protein
VLSACSGKLSRDGAWGGAAHSQQQPALGAEALDQRRRHDSSLLSNIGQGELRRAAALHNAAGGGENLLVRSFARAGAHFALVRPLGGLARITEWLFIFHLTLLNVRL